MYDLLLKGGTVVDAASGLDGVLDVAIENGKIARIAAGIAAAEAARVIEVGGKLSVGNIRTLRRRPPRRKGDNISAEGGR